MWVLDICHGLITSLHLILTIKPFKISDAQGFSSSLYNTELAEAIVSAVAMIFYTIDHTVSDSDLSILLLGSTDLIVLVYNTVFTSVGFIQKPIVCCCSSSFPSRSAVSLQFFVYVPITYENVLLLDGSQG